MENDTSALLHRLDELHTTPMGAARIRRNLRLAQEDVVGWCRRAILRPGGKITRQGKNWYIEANGCRITVNANSVTIITAHPLKQR